MADDEVYALLQHERLVSNLKDHPQLDAKVVWIEQIVDYFRGHIATKSSPAEILQAIRQSCSTIGFADLSVQSPTRVDNTIAFQYEEDESAEDFFVPYLWQLVRSSTSEFNWSWIEIRQ